MKFSKHTQKGNNAYLKHVTDHENSLDNVEEKKLLYKAMSSYYLLYR